MSVWGYDKWSYDIQNLKKCVGVVISIENYCL